MKSLMWTICLISLYFISLDNAGNGDIMTGNEWEVEREQKERRLRHQRSLEDSQLRALIDYNDQRIGYKLDANLNILDSSNVETNQILGKIVFCKAYCDVHQFDEIYNVWCMAEMKNTTRECTNLSSNVRNRNLLPDPTIHYRHVQISQRTYQDYYVPNYIGENKRYFERIDNICLYEIKSNPKAAIKDWKLISPDQQFHAEKNVVLFDVNQVSQRSFRYVYLSYNGCHSKLNFCYKPETYKIPDEENLNVMECYELHWVARNDGILELKPVESKISDRLVGKTVKEMKHVSYAIDLRNAYAGNRNPPCGNMTNLLNIVHKLSHEVCMSSPPLINIAKNFNKFTGEDITHTELIDDKSSTVNCRRSSIWALQYCKLQATNGVQKMASTNTFEPVELVPTDKLILATQTQRREEEQKRREEEEERLAGFDNFATIGADFW